MTAKIKLKEPENKIEKMPRRIKQKDKRMGAGGTMKQWNTFKYYIFRFSLGG